MTVISKEMCKIIAEEMMQAANAVAVKHGLNAKKGKGTYNETEFNMKVDFFTAAQTESGETISSLTTPHQIKCFTLYATQYDMKPEWLGATFKIRNEEFKVIGLNTRSPKNCVLLEKLANKALCHCPPQTVIHGMSHH